MVIFKKRSDLIEDPPDDLAIIEKRSDLYEDPPQDLTQLWLHMLKVLFLEGGQMMILVENNYMVNFECGFFKFDYIPMVLSYFVFIYIFP